MIDFLLSKTVKAWGAGLFTGLLVGIWLGIGMKMHTVYEDCRVMGSVRVGDAAFKCEQFSRAVLLPEKK